MFSVAFEQGDGFVYLTWFCPSDPIALMESAFSIAGVSLLSISCQQKFSSNPRVGYLCSPLYLEAGVTRSVSVARFADASSAVCPLIFSVLVFQRDGHSEPTHLFCILNLG